VYSIMFVKVLTCLSQGMTKNLLVQSINKCLLLLFLAANKNPSGTYKNYTARMPASLRSCSYTINVFTKQELAKSFKSRSQQRTYYNSVRTNSHPVANSHPVGKKSFI
jgi:hypothetical protein